VALFTEFPVWITRAPHDMVPPGGLTAWQWGPKASAIR